MLIMRTNRTRMEDLTLSNLLTAKKLEQEEVSMFRITLRNMDEVELLRVMIASFNLAINSGNKPIIPLLPASLN